MSAQLLPPQTERCLDRAAEVYANALADLTTQTPSEAAAAAYVPGGPSLGELTDRIKQRRTA